MSIIIPTFVKPSLIHFISLLPYFLKMVQHVINISQHIGTSDALLRQLGISIFEASKPYIEKGEAVVLDFDGMTTVGTAFFHASVGNLYKLSNNHFEHLVRIKNMTQPDWVWKYEYALTLARNPRKQDALKKAIAELAD
jgi:hypothetical protein